MNYITILFLIFVNSHCTHGTSCVNSPYYIRDQSQIVGKARIQFYTGRTARLNIVLNQNLKHFKNLQNISLTA